MRIVGWIALALFLVAVAGAGWFVYQVGGFNNAWGILRYDQREEGTLAVGDRAPDVALLALDGSRVRLHERLGGERPLVLVFGSYT